MRLAVLYNDDEALAGGDPLDGIAVAAVRGEARAVAEAARQRGHQVTMHGLRRDLVELASLLRALELEADLVFNLVEALGGEARLEPAVPWMLEVARIPFTGSGPVALTLCLDKHRTKAILRDQGVPVADGRLLCTGDEPLEGLAFPALVKPAQQDASHGIDGRSVVQDEQAARNLARELIARFGQPALVEAFLPGREFNVGLLGRGAAAQVLDLSEIDFSSFPADRPPLVTYQAKWCEQSEDYLKTPVRACPELAPELAGTLRRIARAAYGALDLRGYGRVDIRLDAAGAPRVLEVNPNPDISPEAGLARAAARSGIPYDELIGRILDDALTAD